MLFSDRKWPPVPYRAKLIHDWVRPPRPKRDLETDHLRPSNFKLGARTLRSVEHTPSKFGHDLCRVRRGLVAAVKCCLRKTRFFAVRAGCGTERKKPEGLVRVSTPQRGKPVLFSVFRSYNCRPKASNYRTRKQKKKRDFPSSY